MRREAMRAACALVLVWVAVLSGQDFLDSERFASAQGEFAERLELHEERGELLRWIASGFTVIAVASAWWHARRGALGVVLNVALAAAGVLLVVWTILTGDAGAQAVWGA